jgi:hypothetical protein
LSIATPVFEFRVLPMGAAARFTTGANVLDGGKGDFYKLGVSVTF